MNGMSRRRVSVRSMAQETSGYVLMESTRRAIERMAEDFARDALADPEFRAYLRSEAVAAARAIARSYQAQMRRSKRGKGRGRATRATAASG